MVVDLRAEEKEQAEKTKQASNATDVPIFIYWAVCILLAVVFLRDWLMQWNVGETLARPWLVAYLIITLIISQAIYFFVASDDGRPFRWGPTLIFTIGNGVFEAFAFAFVYYAGEILGSWIFNLFYPAGAHIAGLVVGIIFFIIYGGMIHALFWIKLLPPHFKSTPNVLLIRKYRPMAEVFLVAGWALCFWLSRDVWTVVIIHIILDFCMMVRIRPELFGSVLGHNNTQTAGHSS